MNSRAGLTGSYDYESFRAAIAAGKAMTLLLTVGGAACIPLYVPIRGTDYGIWLPAWRHLSNWTIRYLSESEHGGFTDMGILLSCFYSIGFLFIAEPSWKTPTASSDGKGTMQVSKPGENNFHSQMSHGSVHLQAASWGWLNSGKNHYARRNMRNCLDKITLSSTHLLSLINDILDIQNWKRKIELHPNSLTWDSFCVPDDCISCSDKPSRLTRLSGVFLTVRLKEYLVGDALRLNEYY